MLTRIPASTSAATNAALAVGSDKTSTLASESNPHEWLYLAAQSLLGKDAGYGLHLLTGYPESSCYAYVASDPAKRRRPPEHFIRKICHTEEGFYLAFMQGCVAPWWILREQDRADAEALRAFERSRLKSGG
jgi:hypothetical protein